MQQKLVEYINTVKSDSSADQVAVYYRDLSNGPWMGINEEDAFSPASLLKVPTLISALKYAETHPDYLYATIKYFTPGNSSQDIMPEDTLMPGQTYSIKELLEHMIVYSDNQALFIIFQTLPIDLLNEVYYQLGIDISVNAKPDQEQIMSVREYASFFRILYNASYLNKDMSELALSILSKSEFNKGIKSGLPNGITVAHKFGERYFKETNTRQLHDCGIVYLDDKPYILCIMTRGKDFTKLEDIIGTISKIIYETLRAHS